jgi:hypothetical protein
MMNRRLLLGIFLFFSVCLMLPLSAHAYIDPATTSYVIQIVSAIVITLGITIGVFLGRIRMFFLNARVRTTEWRIRLRTKNRGSKVSNYASQFAGYQLTPRSKWANLWHDNRTHVQRLLTAFCISLGVTFTFIVFGPYEMYALNVEVFAFRLSDIYAGILILAAIVLVLLIVPMMLLRGKLFDVAVSILLGVLLAGYIQGNFLNSALGQLTGDFIDWSQHARDFIINLLVWVFIALLPLLIHYFWPKVWAFSVRFVPMLLVLMQLVSMLALKGDVDKYQPDTEHYLSTAGLYEVAAEDNIIVIILDRMDNTYVDALLNSQPQLIDKFDGFTRYTNNTTLYTATFPAVCYMLTGKVHMYDSPRSEYFQDAYKNSTFLPTLRKNGYEVKMYTEARFSYDSAADLVGLADNVAIAELSVQGDAAIKEFLLLSAYRYAPISFKPFFWTSTGRFTQVLNKDTDPAPYITDDALFYETLRSRRLTVSPHDKSFSFIHLQGMHAPFTIDEQAQRIPANQGTVMGQAEGSFRIAIEYLDQLKELGLYESSTIIITGDHGARANDHQAPRGPITSGLFIKPKGKAGTALTTNNAPVSDSNFQASIFKAAGLPYSDLGQAYSDVPVDSQAPRYLYHLLVESNEGPERMLIYEIGQNARDFSMWKVQEELLVTYSKRQ